MTKLTTEKKLVPIHLIEPNPFNPNKMPDFVFQQMKKVITEKGLFGSIYVRPYLGFYQILDGEHRFKVCKELGYTELPVECSVSEITDQEAKFWTIYFNNTRGKDDVEKKANLIKELEEGQQSFLPYTADELSNIKELVSFDFSQFETKQDNLTEEFGKLLTFKLSETQYEAVDKAIRFEQKQGKTSVEWFLELVRRFYLGSTFTGDEIKESLVKLSTVELEKQTI